MTLKEIILLTALLSGALYNTDNSILRMVLIGLWGFLPIIGFGLHETIIIKKKQIAEIFYIIIIILLLLLCFIFNIDSLKFGFEGSQVEKMTPFLYIFHVTTLFYFMPLYKGDINKNFVYRFFVILTGILVLDMLVRYVQAPNLFLNNSTRQSAKNLGFFNNTNIVGQIIAFVLVVSWQIQIKHKKAIQIILAFVLFTTMARSAMVAVIAVYIFSYLTTKSGFLSKIISIGFFTFTILFIVIDPLGLLDDGSLLSKINFFKSSYDLVLNSSWKDIMFGFSGSVEGVSRALNVDDHSPHVAALKAFLYYGMTGVAIFLFIPLHFVYIEKKLLFPVTVYLIMSLAGAPIFWPTISVGLILIMANNNIARQKELV